MADNKKHDQPKDQASTDEKKELKDDSKKEEALKRAQEQPKEEVKEKQKTAQVEEKLASKPVETKPEEKESQKAQKKTESPEAEISAKLAKIIEQIEKLSVLELADLVKALEEKFGVAAGTMPTVASLAAPGAIPEAGKSEGLSPEQTIFNLVLTSTGGNKIAVIKALREIKPTLGLQEAKGIAESAPKEILSQVNKKQAEEAKQKLAAAGASVELK